jgi:hypothetical protein
LAETHPELAAQAVGWDPTTVKAGSHKKLAWKCKLGHRWDAVIASRALNERGCPICANQKMYVGLNDLLTKHPALAAQADGWDPSKVGAGSHKKLSWICVSGHRWITSPSKRSTRSQGCPYCSGNLVIIGETDLATTHPDIAAQADGWDPTTIKAGSHKKLGWKGPCGHQWNADVASRALVGSGCPFCANLKILIGFNDLATTHPAVAAQAHGWDPKTVVAGTSKKRAWKCEFGHEWSTAVSSRALAELGCPICSNQKILVGFNDLATTHPDIAAQADGWDPTTKTAGSTNRKVGWRGECGHKWKTVVAHRTAGQGCPVCSSRPIALAGFNDLATVNPELASVADGWNPNSVTISSGKRLGWKCKLGHQWKSTVASRSMGGGCPYCANYTVLSGFNDLATTHPELAKQANGWDPKTVVAGTSNRRAWKGTCNHEWIAGVASRAKNSSDCPVCANRKLLIGFNDLKTKRPDLAAQAVGWDPTTVIAGAASRRRWLCEQGHEWVTTVDKRMAGRGCPSCAKSGFDPNKPGFLYLIDHYDFQLLQIGISNFPEDRLDDHKRRGWEVIELRGPMDGHLTQQLETDCLHALERRGAILGHKAGIEKFDGYTEAWTKKSLSVTSIKQILDWVYEDEGATIQ